MDQVFGRDTLNSPGRTSCFAVTFPSFVCFFFLLPPPGFCSRHQRAGLVPRAVQAGLPARRGAVGAGRPPPVPGRGSEPGRRALAGPVPGESRRPGDGRACRGDLQVGGACGRKITLSR